MIGHGQPTLIPTYVQHRELHYDTVRITRTQKLIYFKAFASITEHHQDLDIKALEAGCCPKWS
jgi:hypothetical protein